MVNLACRKGSGKRATGMGKTRGGAVHLRNAKMPLPPRHSAHPLPGAPSTHEAHGFYHDAVRRVATVFE